jgi:hypothetical protein
MGYHDDIRRDLNAAAVAGSDALRAQTDNGTLEATIARADSMSVAFSSFLFTSDKLATAETPALSRIADQLASRLTYLLEPLRVIEVDGQAGAVQMRSHPPYQRQEQTRYYEVLVQRGGSVSLLRYERQPGEPRTAIPATVTEEVFFRLADDFAAAVRS